MAKKLIFVKFGITIGLSVVGCAQNNFALKSETIRVKRYDPNRGAVSYNLPISEFTIAAKFRVWEVQTIKYNAQTRTEMHEGSVFQIEPDPSPGGMQITQRKVGDYDKMFAIDLHKSHSPYVNVSSLVINVSEKGCITSITSQLEDKKKEIISNYIKTAFNIYSLSNGGAFVPKSTDEKTRRVRRENLDFTVTKTFYADDRDLEKDGNDYYLDIRPELRVFYKRLMKSDPVPKFRLYLEGENFKSYSAQEVLSKLAVAGDSSRRVPGAVKSRLGGEKNNLSRDSQKTSNPVKSVISGIIYPLPQLIKGTLKYNGEAIATIRINSIQGGGFDRLQIASKSFSTRNYTYNFGDNTGRPTVVNYSGTSQANGASQAASELTGEILKLRKDYKTAKDEAADNQKTLISEIAVAERALITQRQKVDALNRQIEAAEDAERKIELKNELELEQITLKEKEEVLKLLKSKR